MTDLAFTISDNPDALVLTCIRSPRHGVSVNDIAKEIGITGTEVMRAVRRLRRVYEIFGKNTDEFGMTIYASESGWPQIYADGCRAYDRLELLEN
jgi:hypothetical protein